MKIITKRLFHFYWSDSDSFCELKTILDWWYWFEWSASSNDFRFWRNKTQFTEDRSDALKLSQKNHSSLVIFHWNGRSSMRSISSKNLENCWKTKFHFPFLAHNVTQDEFLSIKNQSQWFSLWKHRERTSKNYRPTSFRISTLLNSCSLLYVWRPKRFYLFHFQTKCEIDDT